jgi:PatG C-terminal
MLPIVLFDQVWSFDREALIAALPRPASIPARGEQQFRASAGELLDRIMQIADNAGNTDEHRALNYLAVRYPAIYERAADAHERNFSLVAVEARTSRLSGARRILDVVFTYSHRQTDVPERYFVRVDVTEEFPFLVTRLQPYFER